jgi:hypothetical protein
VPVAPVIRIVRVIAPSIWGVCLSSICRIQAIGDQRSAISKCGAGLIAVRSSLAVQCSTTMQLQFSP